MKRLPIVLLASLLAGAAQAQAPAAGRAPDAGRVVSLISQGARCDGATDDTRAIRAWIARLGPRTLLAAPAGVCNFSDTIAIPGGIDNAAIKGAGVNLTTFNYVGPGAAKDLFVVGDGVTPDVGWTLSGFLIQSQTKMTGGSALHLRRFQRSFIDQVSVDGQDGNGKLWDGVWFDQIDEVFYTNFQARGANDALRVNGDPKWGQAGLYLAHFKASQSNIGIHIAGGFGGFVCDTGDIIANRTNMRIDNSVSGTGNLQTFTNPQCFLDSAIGTNLEIDDAASKQSVVSIQGGIGTGGGPGIDVIHMPFGKLSIASPYITAVTDGVRVQDPTTQIAFSTATQVFSNSGYGVNATAPTNGISPGNQFLGNKAGAYSPDARIQSLDPARGFIKFPNGLIYQWFQVSFAGPANTVLKPIGGQPTLPVPCSLAILQNTATATLFGFPNGPQSVAASVTPNGKTGIFASLTSSGPVTNPQPVNIGLWCE